MKPSYILDKVREGARISKEEALCLYKEADFLAIQFAARDRRHALTDADIVTYTIFQIVNYTTFCNVDCSFCSFYKPYSSAQGKTLSKDEILDKVHSGTTNNANQVFLQGGVDERIPLDYYIDIISSIKEKFGKAMHIRAFSPVELLNIAKVANLELPATLELLKSAGIDSVPGAGAEILTDRMRQILSPKKCTTEEWIYVMETCHNAKLYGSANIVFGSEETKEEVIEHLQIIRDIQDKTNGFLSFIPWTFQPQTKSFKTRFVPTPEFLKVLGICRIFLDNIPHIETSLMVLGQPVGSITLQSGADDLSSVVLEENVLRNYGINTEKQIREFIHNNGFTPRRRSLLYENEEHLVPAENLILNK